MRIAIDTGGTFTDLALLHDSGACEIHKRPTTPSDPAQGILDAIAAAAAAHDLTARELLARCELLVHATTRGLNALLTGGTARTALLVTEGHPDVLVLREGGKDHFNRRDPSPEPYVPRSLTFEVPERVLYDGRVRRPLDEEAVTRVLHELPARRVEAVGVCLLWSIVNPTHELRVGELIEQILPGVPYTLSHAVNPSLREYRRASSTVIDASLKPLMSSYLERLERRLRDEGLAGRLLMVTSSGGVEELARVAAAPIHAIGSGPAMAPIAGRRYAAGVSAADDVVVTDAGGTTFDISIVRGGDIPRTRETWIGPRYLGHMTGFPAVDVRSIGSGGGSIAWVDAGGLLHVGPQSAGADPGPACYRRGGTAATVTDAALVLGYLSAGTFAGAIEVDVSAAHAAIAADVAEPLGLDVVEAAQAILEVLTEQMVQAISDIAVGQGVDPTDALIVAGGGAAGINAVAIGRRLGSRGVLIPDAASALSAVGGLLSDLTREATVACSGRTDELDVEVLARTIDAARRRVLAVAGAEADGARVDLWAEARYPHEVWEIDVQLPGAMDSVSDLERFEAAFHDAHERIFAVRDDRSPVELVAVRAVLTRTIGSTMPLPRIDTGGGDPPRPRLVRLPGSDRQIVPRRVEDLDEGEVVTGPALLEAPSTTIVIDQGARGRRLPGALLVETG